MRNLPKRKLEVALKALISIYHKASNQHTPHIIRILDAVSDYVCTLSGKLTSENVGNIYWAFAKNINMSPNLYSTLLSELGKNYFDLTPVNKSNILSAFGKKGMRDKEVFETFCNDIVANPELFRQHTPEILSSIGETNLEDQPWCKTTVSALMEEYLRSPPQELSYYWFHVLIWSLVKLGAPESMLERAYSLNKVSVWSPRKGFKQYSLFYHFNWTNSLYNDREYFLINRSRLNHPNIFGLTHNTIEPMRKALSAAGHNAICFGELGDIVVPIAIPRKNLALWPTNVWTLTYEGDMLKGEYEFIKRCIERQGGQVMLYSPEQLKGLDEKGLLNWLDSQGITS